MPLHKIFDSLKILKPLLGVFFSLGSIKIAQMLLPLLAIPWLARVLDLRTFGILMYFSILPSIVETIVNWGFNLGAVRDVAFYREGKSRQAKILGAVITAKIMLAAICLLASCALLPVIPYASEYPGVYLLAILYGIARGFRPLWFYLGIGRHMSYMAVWDTLANGIILVLIILIINRPSRWAFYFGLNFICKALIYAFLIWRLSKNWPFHIDWKRAWNILHKTRTLFANSLTNMIHNHTSKLVLGYFLAPAEMGVYMAADKIIKAVSDASEPVSQTIFPEICALRRKNANVACHMLYWSFIFSFGIMLLAAILLWLTDAWLIPFALGSKYAETIPILDIMLIALPVMGINSVLGPQVLVANGYERLYFLSSVFVACASLPLAIALPTLFGLQGAACLNLILSSLFFLAMSWAIWKYYPEAFSSKLTV